MIAWLSAALRSLRHVGDQPTAGDHEDALPEWDGGRLSWARWIAAHPGRVGRAIRPWAAVLHTTDMRPETFGALCRSWASKPGAGNAAHFLIGRTAAEGTVQFVDVGRNANHAGGLVHGWFTAGGERYHPNAVSVGIEVHNAGEVRLVAGQWRMGYYQHGWHPHGAPLDPADVVVDERRRKDRGCHRPTDWQLAEVARLLAALAEGPMVTAPDGWGVVGTAPVKPWALRNDRYPYALVGHHTLDAAGRSDPHAYLSWWAAERFG